MNVTLEVPDHLAEKVRRSGDELSSVLETGFRYHETGPGYKGMADVLEVLARLPSPEEVLALKPSSAWEERLDHLMEKTQEGELSLSEQREWEQFEQVVHLVRMAKIAADKKLRKK